MAGEEGCVFLLFLDSERGFFTLLPIEYLQFFRRRKAETENFSEPSHCVTGTVTSAMHQLRVALSDAVADAILRRALEIAEARPRSFFK